MAARDLGGVHFVALEGELDIVSSVGLADALADAAGFFPRCRSVGTTFMDSSGISAFVVARNRILPTDSADF
jgi:hypothetical protein